MVSDKGMSWEVINSVETSDLFGRRQHLWIVRVGRALYLVSHIERAEDTGNPECLAFPCDKGGQVDSWSESASSFEADPQTALREVAEQLLELSSEGAPR